MVGVSVCLSVCVFVSPVKTVKPIELPFGRLSGMGPRNHVLDGRADLPRGRYILGVMRLIKKH